ncbi:MAG TPA: hypothetical protein VNX22_09475, partial [Acidobacteriaceae bacterium]|nr:hypothetical protein [Acidobacteriaceae bacterium]
EIETESEVSPGSLYASGLIAAGGIVGLLGVGLKLYEGATNRTVHLWFAEGTTPYQLLRHQWISVVMFGVLAFSLYYFARKPLEVGAPPAENEAGS